MYDVSNEVDRIQPPRTEGVSTRSSNKKMLKVKKPRTEKFKKSFSYVGPKKWNLLPKSIQLTDSRTDFKTQIKAYIELKSKANALLVDEVD